MDPAALEVEALDLHIRALVSAKEGDLAGSAEAFAAAQQWESSHGYARGALHTSHQSALVMNFGGDLERLRRYYQETLRTLKKIRNREGIALCLRSTGELAIVNANLAEAIKAWELSVSFFVALQLAESRQVRAWLERVRG